METAFAILGLWISLLMLRDLWRPPPTPFMYSPRWSRIVLGCWAYVVFSFTIGLYIPRLPLRLDVFLLLPTLGAMVVGVAAPLWFLIHRTIAGPHPAASEASRGDPIATGTPPRAPEPPPQLGSAPRPRRSSSWKSWSGGGRQIGTRGPT